MRVIVLTLMTLVISSLPFSASAAPCPPGMVQVCKQQPVNRPPRGTPCKCESAGGSATFGGKAEIHKKNVPTVRPGRTPGPNN
jgi:hypothetical protein